MANQTDRATIDLVINGQQSETSLKQITTAAVNARKALSSMAETDPGYKKQKAELEALMRAQQQRIVRINEEKTAWEKFKAGTGNVMAGVVGGNVLSAGLATAGRAISATIDTMREFNAASKELSAVTGLAGRDLEYLEKQAARTGPAVGKSGAEMLEAYKLMASAKPELLANKELLAETTKAAITLSQAGKIDLAEATKVTAESLNQFGEGADQANRFINAIAAGSKEGSAEINEMGAALKNAGTVASAQGVSFEQTNAILQSLSSIALKGGEAGTGLRNVLLTLGSGADETNPKMVGLDVALDNLAKKNLSTAEMTKLFGKENLVAAQHIITHRGEITELTDKITGTQEAFSQAAKNNASFDAQLAKFYATLSGIGVMIGTVILPVLNKFLGGAQAVANFIAGSLTPASEAATQAFDDQRSAVQNLQTQFVPLLNRHDELKKKTVLTNNEQAELDSIVAQVAETVPSAVTQFDKYGKALAVSTDKAREFVKMQQLMLKEKNADAIQKNTEALKEEEAQLARNIAKRKAGTIQERDATSFGGAYKNRQMTDAELRELDKANAELKGKVDERQLLLKGLTGDYLNTPTEKPGVDPKKPKWGNGDGTASSSGTDAEETKEEKKARLKREKAEREEKRKEKSAQQHEDKLTSLMEAARARTAQFEGESFEKEQIQFGDHYAELYKLAGTNKEKMAEITQLMYTELAAITQKEEERQKKAAEKKADEELKKKKDEYNAAGDALAMRYERERALYEPLEDELAKTDDDRKLYALAREEKFLIAQQLLAQTYGESEAEIQKKLTDNHVEQARIRRQTTEQTNEALRQSNWQTMAAYAGALEQGASALKEFLHKGTVAYKAVIVAQKAGAIAQVIINTQKEISGIWADPFYTGLGPAGLALKTGLAVAAGVRGAASIATISKQGATEIAEKDDGGYTGIRDLYGSPEGFMDRPTRVNAGRRSYIVGEKRKEWIMGGAMLSNPVMANLAGALQTLQVTGGYRNLSVNNTPVDSLGSGAGGGSSDALLMQLIQEMQQNRLATQELAKRPINNSYFKLRETQERVAHIENVTKL